MKNLLLLTFIFTVSFSFSQIRMGQIETSGKKEQIDNVESVPVYDSIQNFVNYWRYCNGDKYNDPYHFKHMEGVKPCNLNDFYKRYIGLQIYYPDYKNNYRENEIHLFKNSNFDSISWAQAGDKTYKIIDIKAGTNNFYQYNILKNKYPNLHFNEENEDFNHALIFILKDMNSNDTLYVVDNECSNQEFILIPYLNSLKRLCLNKNFILNDYEGCLVKPNENNRYWTEPNEILKCIDIFIVHNSSLYDPAVCNCEGQDITILYKFKRDSIIYYFDDNYDRSGKFMPNIMYYFTLKNEYDEQKIIEKEIKLKEENIKKNNLISKFGKEYGILIYSKKVKVGMTKKMCIEAWGETSLCRKFIDKEGESEVCQYNNGTLVFRNGILTKIMY